MKIKLLIKKIKYKIVKFLYNYFKKIYIRNINIDDNEILQYAHNELTIYGYNKDSKYYNDIIEVIAAISKNNNINSSIKHNISVINKLSEDIILLLKNGLKMKILFAGMEDYLNMKIMFLLVDILKLAIYNDII